MNLLLFITVLIVSFIVVRIGAIAFELTGLEWSLAKFQALSCFTGTGFTTRESELITSNPQRRRIASTLIILGHAGFVTMIATVANSLRPLAAGEERTLPFMPSITSPSLYPWVNLGVIVVAIYIIYKIFSLTGIGRKLTQLIRNRLVAQHIVAPVFFEELMVATGGYGVSRIEVAEGSGVLNKKLYESGLKSHDIMVLAITRKGVTIPNPPAGEDILLGDGLICFGKLDNIRNIVSMPDKQQA